MTTPLHRLFQTKALDSGNTLVTASTPDVDRYDDIIEAPWKLKNFRANPVIPWGHDYSQPPIGRAVDVREEGGVLIAEIEWDMHESNPLGMLVGSQYRREMLSAVSVGFYPGTSVKRASLDKADPRFAEGWGMVHSHNELLEISAVSIPANPHATVQARSVVPALEQLQDWTAEGFKGHLRDTLLALLHEDPAIRAALESMVLAQQVEVKPSSFW